MSSLIKIYTDTEVTIARLKDELYVNGISSLVKNGFQSGAIAGFGGGQPSLRDLFIDSDDMEKASKIIHQIISK
ncbi:MAG: hypothetical protein ACI85Q_000150 [Salibacteraceae bacterium]|jgi:hypothetical protein